jgi:hypothetical protein
MSSGVAGMGSEGHRIIPADWVVLPAAEHRWALGSGLCATRRPPRWRWRITWQPSEDWVSVSGHLEVAIAFAATGSASNRIWRPGRLTPSCPDEPPRSPGRCRPTFDERDVLSYRNFRAMQYWTQSGRYLTPCAFFCSPRLERVVGQLSRPAARLTGRDVWESISVFRPPARPADDQGWSCESVPSHGCSGRATKCP